METSKIAFVRDRDGLFDIFTMNEDGTDQTNITRTPDYEKDHVSWSPDGTRIAYCDRRHGKGEIYVINADGSEPRRLTHNSAPDLRSHWSPDGQTIIFCTDRHDNVEIYAMNSDGSNQRNLTNHPAYELESTFSPDGSKKLSENPLRAISRSVQAIYASSVFHRARRA